MLVPTRNRERMSGRWWRKWPLKIQQFIGEDR
jgi:hypothetical protein